MNSKFLTKKTAFIFLGAITAVIAVCVLLNIFVVRPGVIRDQNADVININGEEVTVPGMEQRVSDDGFVYNLITSDDGVTFASIADYNGNEKNIVIPNTIEGYPVKELGGFMHNETVESIEIPSSVKYIENFSFDGCTNLKRIVVPPSVTSIGEQIAADCNNAVIYGDDGSYAQQYAKENSIPFTVIEQ